VDSNTSGAGAFLGATLLTAPMGSLPASSYSVGSDNRGCLTLTDSGGRSETFRFAVGALNSLNVATQGRIIRFDDVTWRDRAESGVLMLQDPNSFNLGAFKGTYADGFVGVDINGGRFSSAGLVTSANGDGTLSNITADVNDGGTATTVMGGAGTYGVAMNAPGGRGTATVTIPGAPTSNLVIYMVSPSEILAMTTDPITVANVIESGELRKQTGPFSAASLDGKDYVFYLGGIHTSDGGNDAVIGQTHFEPGANGNATITLDENKSGALASTPPTPGAVFTINPANGRTTLTGLPPNPASVTEVLYLINSNSAFIVGSGGGGPSGFVEQQVGGPFSTSTIASGQYFFGAEAPSTAGSYQSGTINLNAGQVTGIGDVTEPSGLRTESISPTNGGTDSFSSSSTTLGKGTVGPLPPPPHKARRLQ